ncbi:hypothetical protein ACI2IX_11035 [Leifsonia aquatica]|uniref:hypothetical protein n=1 Tax=Leifsonia aquatica TaxID=144185 RepID=UPI00384C59FC
MEGLVYGRRQDWDCGGEVRLDGLGYLDQIDSVADLRDAAQRAEDLGHAIMLFVAENELFAELPVAPHEVLVFGIESDRASVVLYDPRRRLVETSIPFEDLARAFSEARTYRELACRSACLHPSTPAPSNRQDLLRGLAAYADGTAYDIDQNAREHWWWGTWWGPGPEEYTAQGFGADAFDVVAHYFDTFASSPLLDLRHFAAFVDHVAAFSALLWAHIDLQARLELEDMSSSLRAIQVDVRYQSIRRAYPGTLGPIVRRFSDLSRSIARTVLENENKARTQ